MKILAAGDSFTYGDNLPDLSKAYPYLVAEKFGGRVVNTARGGYSNQSIMREIIDNFDDTFDLVLVGFAYPGRTEFSDQSSTFNLWPGYQSKYTKDLIHRNDLSKYITLYHNDTWLFSNFFRIALSIESFLLQRNKPFLFYCIENYNEHHYKNYPDIINRYKSKFLSPYSQLIFNINENMCAWRNENVLPCGHPNELGHQLIAEKIYEHCRNICGLS